MEAQDFWTLLTQGYTLWVHLLGAHHKFFNMELSTTSQQPEDYLKLKHLAEAKSTR